MSNYIQNEITKNGAFIRSVMVTQSIDLNRPHYNLKVL